MNVLHLDSSALGGASVSRQITAAIVAGIRASQAAAGATTEVRYRDLALENIPHLSGELLAALRPAPGSTPSLSEHARDELSRTEDLLAEFLAADVLVVGAPMYNFSVPTQLKAWIDRVAQAGRTFRYTADGPQGLAGGKKVFIVSSRGSMIAGGANETALDHQEAYLRTVFGFLGIQDLSVIRAEGIGYGPDARAQAIAKALDDAQLASARVGSSNARTGQKQEALA